MGGIFQVNATELPESATDEEIKAEFFQLKENALYEHGHSGYSGTIAEADGLKIRRDVKLSDCNCNKAYEMTEKWGPAIAVLELRNENYFFSFIGMYSS